MMPIDFCASLEPCDSAIALADTSCIQREARCTVLGRIRLTSHRSAIITTKAATKPMVGDSTSGSSTFDLSALHLKACTPACATTAPASAPTSACDELDGMPYHQVMRFQTIAPMSAASTIVCVTIAGSAKPEAIV